MNKTSISWITAAGATGATTLYGMFPDQVAYTAQHLTAAGTVVTGYTTAGWVITFPHRWNWINPLHRALCGPLGTEDYRPSRYIQIPRGYQGREVIGRVYLPDTFTGIDKSTAATIVKNKLGLTDVTVSYHLEGRRPYMEIRQTPRPPAQVLIAEYADAMASAKESAPLLGIGPKGIAVAVDLDADSPHILVSASTGGGKSVILRAITCQILHHGGQGVILDYKRHSHLWARGLQQVSYRRDIAEIHDALIRLGLEGHRRNRVFEEWDGDGPPDVGPRIAIIFEEANATIGRLRKYWTRIRTAGEPKESPAIEALNEVLFMGRAVKMHMLMVAQSATARALGGPEVRECFSSRILARYSANAWKMLAPEVSPMPRSTRHKGRAQVVSAGAATETQILFTEDVQAREWACSGTVAPAPAFMSRDITGALSQVSEAGVTSRDVTPTVSLVKEIVPERRVNLAQASVDRGEGIVPMKADALRQAKRRPGFPPGENGTWAPEELRHWYDNRPSTRVG